MFSEASKGLLMKWTAWFQTRGRLTAALYDIFIIPFAWFGAFWLRFNLDGIPHDALTVAFMAFPVVLVLQTGAYWSLGLYRGVWRFASLPDLVRIFKAVSIGVLGTLVVLFLVPRLQGFPRSVLPIYSMLLVLFLGGGRFFVRWLKEPRTRKRSGQSVLIVGTGEAAEGLVRDLLRDSQRNFKPVAFVDDRKNKQDQEIHGIRVVGVCNDIPVIVEKYDIELIIIALPHAKGREMRRIMELCQGTKCPVRTLPSTNDLVSGRVSLDLLREVSLEDLLGRDPVALDWTNIGKAIAQQVVLVTGGGGSIGSELCRQIARLNPRHLIVVERSEFNLFTLEQEFKERFPNLTLSYHLLDINDRIAIHEILFRHRPDIVFHAAAYKHVPLLESQPREAITNNILGTQTMAELSVMAKVRKFVLVSTDKAVNPTNVMGASKRASEMICHYYNDQGETRFITVRFGNVLGSAGSVVPIFRQQIENGGPVTVTHPEVMRYFMTIPEACQLILQALTIGVSGEIFVLDMGEPIKIQYLAEQMIRLAGKMVDEDIEIEYSGLRPGEKLFEELFHPDEALETTQHEKIFKAKARELEARSLTEILKGLEQAANVYDEPKLLSLLQKLIPELQYQSAIEEKTIGEAIPSSLAQPIYV